MALEQVSAITKSTYLNTINGYVIQYNVSQDEGQNAQSVNGIINKANVSFGDITINSDGSKYINFKKGISDDDSKAIYEAVLSDASSIFAQRNTTE